jgi:Na+/H+ antiporter NhaC
MDDHPYGFLSIVPPLTAILLAIATRRIVLSLAVGVLIGCATLHDGALAAMAVDFFETRLWRMLVNEDHLRVFAFTTLMGALVGVISRSGGMKAVVGGLSKFARSRRGGQLTTWAMGLVVFFDDYANSLLLGGTMRPLADRLKISREKLAYLVDATAAPVSGIALISTWVAGEIGFIQNGLDAFGPESFTTHNDVSAEAFNLFVETIPYRFYVLLTLLFVPLVALLRRDFGPMLAAERRAIAGQVDGSSPAKSLESSPIEPDDDARGRWYDAVAPVALTIAVAVWLLIATGRANNESLSLIDAFSNGNSYLSLVYASVAGLTLAILLSVVGRTAPLDKIRAAAAHGALATVPALAILWLSWSLSDVLAGKSDIPSLQMADYLTLHVKSVVDVRWMPTIVFLAAAGVSFATGTSWGTMGILMTPAISVTYNLLAQVAGGPIAMHDPTLVATIGAVLAGAIFGDHCSPISDTTILSSLASGCNHMAHVTTQMPYALFVAAASIICGTLPVGFGLSVWLALPLGAGVLVVGLLALGKRTD